LGWVHHKSRNPKRTHLRPVVQAHNNISALYPYYTPPLPLYILEPPDVVAVLFLRPKAQRLRRMGTIYYNPPLVPRQRASARIRCETSRVYLADLMIVDNLYRRLNHQTDIPDTPST